MHIVIIGAGILGCAIARHICMKRTEIKVSVLEACKGPGLVTSQQNSGVFHAGMHLHPESLKARLAVRGRLAALSYCQEKGIRVQRSGMLIVGTWQDGINALQQAPEFIRILRQGKKLGIHLDVLTPWQIRTREPHVHALAGIAADDVAIVDREAFVQSIYADARAGGATFHFRTLVTNIHRRDSFSWEVQTPQGTLQANYIINAAGPNAQRLAAMCNIKHDVRYVRGEYAEVVGGNQGRFASLVYPVPRTDEGGLGVHITPTVDGRLLVGPNTVVVQRPDDLGDYVPRKSLDFFRERVRPFWPDVQKVKLALGPAGIRTKSATGDFQFLKYEESIHILGYESPGFTAALATAEYIYETFLANNVRSTPS